MSWLNDHLETFVFPHVGRELYLLTPPPCERFGSEKMTIIKNAWRSAKSSARGKQIVLLGRDVWLFEVLARREGYPTIFDPRCSRQTSYHPEFSRRFSYRTHIMLDTGFEGSIANVLNLDCVLVSANKFSPKVGKKQIFPTLKGSRSLALMIEATPKYWKSAIIVDGGIKQEFSNPAEFVRAGKLTEEVYKDSSARFIGKRNPLGVGRYTV